MRIFYFILILFSVLLFSCKSLKKEPNKNIIVRIQPFSDMDPGEVKAVTDSIRKFYPNVILNSPVKLPAFAFYEPRGRYKADSLLKFLSSLAKTNETLVGLTVMDISTRNGANPDWGVMGLVSCPGNSCVASTFRLNLTKGKNQLFKVAIHELGHTFGLPHCPDPACFMRDAKGGNPTDEEKDFCINCRQYLRSYSWRL